MDYHKYQPDKLLQKYIEYYWILETKSTWLDMPLYANANTDLFISIISLKGDLSVSSDKLNIRGPATLPHICKCLPNCTYIGIRFRPGGLPIFYQIPLPEIVDRTCEIDDSQLKLVLFNDESLSSRLDKYFLTKMKEKLSAEKLTDIVFEAKGQISVSQLARMCNLSSRTLERHCYFNIGIGPKEFISIVRFKSAIWALESDKAEISGRIAVRMGYYDQSHFIKEIKKRTGFLPSCLFKIRQFP